MISCKNRLELFRITPITMLLGFRWDGKNVGTLSCPKSETFWFLIGRFMSCDKKQFLHSHVKSM